jgi:uncharacterized membrane protein YhaH (DUF805 family)/RNA polymerase subunit RPABC4/transcription elongation factor Spt4
MEETKRCPYCGEEILVIAKKCKYCGEWLSEEPAPKKMIACPICGEQIEEDTEICPYCHERIKEEVADSYSSQSYPGATEPSGHSSGEHSDDEKPISFFKAYFIEPFFTKYREFSGTATIKEFWFSVLCLLAIFTLILYVSCSIYLIKNPDITSYNIKDSSFIIYVSILFFIGLASVTARRLNDSGKDKWLTLLYAIPGFGYSILFILCSMKGKKKDRNVTFMPSDWIGIGIFVVACILAANIETIAGKTGTYHHHGASVVDTTQVAQADTNRVDTADVSQYAESDTQTQSSNSTESISYKGYIGGKYPVEMELDINRSQTGNEYSGRYRYEGQSDWLELTGTSDADGQNLILSEHNATGQLTGEFEGHENNDGGISGNFTNYRNQTFSFVVFRNN